MPANPRSRLQKFSPPSGASIREPNDSIPRANIPFRPPAVPSTDCWNPMIPPAIGWNNPRMQERVSCSATRAYKSVPGFCEGRQSLWTTAPNSLLWDSGGTDDQVPVLMGPTLQSLSETVFETPRLGTRCLPALFQEGPLRCARHAARAPATVLFAGPCGPRGWTLLSRARLHWILR